MVRVMRIVRNRENEGDDASAGIIMSNELENTQAKKAGGIRIRVLNAILIFLASFVSLMLLQAAQLTNDAFTELEAASDSYIVCESAATNMKDASNYLVSQVHNYVVTQKQQYLDNFFEEELVNKRRESALATLKENLQGKDAYNHLEQALRHSETLVNYEHYALKLVAQAKNASLGKATAVLDDVELSAADDALSPEGKIQRATDLVFGEEYLQEKNLVDTSVTLCREELVTTYDTIQKESSETLRDLLFRQQILTFALLVVVIAFILSFIVIILWPVQHFITRIKDNEPLPQTGAYELRYLAQEYNVMYEENLRNHDQLRRKAEHDHLTGLYNRSVFEKLLYAYRDEPIALLLIDADYFKTVNDTLGHDGGDAMLQKIARSLTETFRSTDYPCRIGGDEFAVVMTEMNPGLKNVVLARIKAVSDHLADTSDGMPVMTLSIGIAFSGEGMDGDALYKNADKALYEVKEAGRNGSRFYEE